MLICNSLIESKWTCAPLSCILRNCLRLFRVSPCLCQCHSFFSSPTVMTDWCIGIGRKFTIPTIIIFTYVSVWFYNLYPVTTLTISVSDPDLSLMILNQIYNSILFVLLLLFCWNPIRSNRINHSYYHLWSIIIRS